MYIDEITVVKNDIHFLIHINMFKFCSHLQKKWI